MRNVLFGGISQVVLPGNKTKGLRFGNLGSQPEDDKSQVILDSRCRTVGVALLEGFFTNMASVIHLTKKSPCSETHVKPNLNPICSPAS